MGRYERRHPGGLRGARSQQRQPRRRMALWEWLVLLLLLGFMIVQLCLRLSGRPGSTIPNWVDAPPYFPAR
jgi:hypothetical protein